MCKNLVGLLQEIIPLRIVEMCASEIQFSLCFKRLGISEPFALVRRLRFPKANQKKDVSCSSYLIMRYNLVLNL